ncbi:Ubiquitin-conjugating enzyme E2G 1 [Spraguea lophii 42_110]|uniref:Ubiquitin-conjugating enzyme E2G 1 n=1 Tax=Spraguea lophii (strain 42_110) TaxID=1358809 RepID=S7WBW4_SPRLO|nr:Ubiquitin-conjugating enzyme E2G 1 [Spraguea lophii 42_110]
MASSENSRSRAFIEKEFQRILEKGNEHFSIGLVDNNIYKWEIIILGPRDTHYENGIFKAHMVFPSEYPEAPPQFLFKTQMHHPNIDKRGMVCISILHKPGEDEYGYEKMEERWMPVRNPESVILSIISLLSAPNCESPSNLDAAQEMRENPEIYKKKVMRLTQKTLE